jgi:DUF917 family protein
MRLGPGELEAAILGGALLGGGGGGSMAEGRRLGHAALAAGTPTLVSWQDLPPDALVATVSLVGAPAAIQACVEPADHLRAWNLLAAQLDRPLAGLIGSENGGAATINGWLQSAALGVPIADAPADGRAHPTGDLGGLGLNLLPGFVSIQAVSGGSPEHGRHLEQIVRAPLPAANHLVRAAAEAAGGLVAVARNPIRADHLGSHAAVGAVTQAIDLGLAMIAVAPRGGRAVAERACEALAGSIVAEDTVATLEIETRGGFDIGLARIGDLELSIWNEYLTLERDGERLATFPDLIATLDADTGEPVTSAELRPGSRMLVLTAPSSSLKLGAGLRIADHYAPLERAIGRDILRYISPAVVGAVVVGAGFSRPSIDNRQSTIVSPKPPVLSPESRR